MAAPPAPARRTRALLTALVGAAAAVRAVPAVRRPKKSGRGGATGSVHARGVADGRTKCSTPRRRRGRRAAQRARARRRRARRRSARRRAKSSVPLKTRVTTRAGALPGRATADAAAADVEADAARLRTRSSELADERQPATSTLIVELAPDADARAPGAARREDRAVSAARSRALPRSRPPRAGRGSRLGRRHDRSHRAVRSCARQRHHPGEVRRASIAGLDVAAEVFSPARSGLRLRTHARQDGDRCQPGDVVAEVARPARPRC